MHYECGRCQVKMASVFYVDANDREIGKKCFDELHPPARCEHCGFPTFVADSLPTKAGGVAHAHCAARVTLALGLERAAILGPTRKGTA